MTIKDIAQSVGKSVRAIALDLGIPLKTAEKWSAGSSEPPAYLLKLIEEHYNRRANRMKIYKVYYEDRAESRRNSAAAFEEIIMEQNGNEGTYYTSEAEAMEAYKSISLMYDVAERFDRYGWFFSGKLIEVAEVDNDAFCEAVAAGEDLRYIYIDACNAEIIEMEVSAEAE